MPQWEVQRLKLTREKILKIERSVRRDIAKENGYYDGRNTPKIFVDRKKESVKKMCRKKEDHSENLSRAEITVQLEGDNEGWLINLIICSGEEKDKMTMTIDRGPQAVTLIAKELKDILKTIMV